STRTTTRAGISGSQVEITTDGLPTKVTGHDGLSVTTYYDPLRRKWKVEDSRGSPKNTTTFGYIAGTALVQTVTDAAGNVTATGYDALGRPNWTRDPHNHFTYTSYNLRGQLVRQWGGASMPVE